MNNTSVISPGIDRTPRTRGSHRRFRTLLWMQTLGITLATILIAISYGVEDPMYLGLAAVNTMVCTWNMFTLRVGDFTLCKFVNLFILIFFILANAIQFGTHTNVLTFGLMFQDEEFVGFQLVVFFILLIYNSFYTLWSRHARKRRYSVPSVIEPKNVYTTKLLLLAAIGTLIILIYMSFNFQALFFRGFLEEFLYDPNKDESPLQTLLFDKLIRSIPVNCLIISLLSPVKRWVRSILFLFALITVFPTGLSRNAAAMYWIPVFLIVMEKWFKGNKLMMLIIIGIFLVFPLLDVFRNSDLSGGDEGGLEYLNTMNYDASQLFMATYLTETITWGNQLIGAIFFFVPRSIWPMKALGSGHFLTSSHGASFFNVSMPFFSEGYINFGWVGMVLFTVFLSYITARIDFSFWSRRKRGMWNYDCGYYLILMGAIIFIMRGDLMSSFAYTAGTLFSYWMCVTTVKNFINPKSRQKVSQQNVMPGRR